MPTQTAEAAEVPRSSRIRAAWRGEAPLAWVFWGFHFGGGLLLVAAGLFGFLFLLPFTVREGQSILASPIFRAYLITWVSVYFAYVVASTVMVWRCSSNVSSPVWGYAARAAIVLWLIRLLFLLRTLVVG